MKKRSCSLPPTILSDVQEIIIRTKKDLRALEAKTILIAGAAGFLPSYLVHTIAYTNVNLLKKPAKIICLDNYTTGIPERLLPWKKDNNIRFLNQDVTKPIKIEGHIDYIVHGASIASPTWYRKFPLETIDANVSGVRNLLELAKANKAFGFLYFSSSEIYGDPLEQFIPTSEDYWGNVSTLGPRACYDESKRLAETICMVYFRQFGIPVKIVRPFNFYGPGLRLDDGRVIPDFINDALNKKKITLFSDGKATRSFCYIADAVVAIFTLLVSKVAGEAFNIGNTEEVSMLQLAQMVNKIVQGKGIRFALSQDQAYLTDNPHRRVPDISKIKGVILWAPRISLIEGLRRTLKFYKEEGWG